jgi:hypothetical protein
MATPTPKRGFHQEFMGVYKPSPAELSALISEIQTLTGIQANPQFTETIKRMLILFRREIDLGQAAPDKFELLEEVQQFSKALNKVKNMLNEMSESLRHGISSQMLSQDMVPKESDSWADPLYNLHSSTLTIAELCGDVENSIKRAEKRGRSLSEFRDIMAQELARALDAAGYKPTATDNGPFEKCWVAFVEAVRCKVKGRNISYPLPAYARKTVLQAIANYPHKERYSGLRPGMIWPGLTD